MLEKRESKLKAVLLVLATGLFFYWRSGLPSNVKIESQIVFPKNIYSETTNNQEIKDFLAKSPTLKESFDKAFEYYSQSQYSDSIVILERIVSENKGFRDGQYLLAEADFKLGQSTNTQNLELVKQIDENKSEIQFNYFDKAEIALKKAIDIDPIDGKLYQLLCEVVDKKGNSARAKEYREKAEALKINS